MKTQYFYNSPTEHDYQGRKNGGGCLPIIWLIAFLIAASLANAQTTTNPLPKDAMNIPVQSKPELLLTDTIILKPTRDQITKLIQLVQHAINLSYSAKLDSEKASIPVFLIQALEALNGIKTEDGKADSIKAKTK